MVDGMRRAPLIGLSLILVIGVALNVSLLLPDSSPSLPATSPDTATTGSAAGDSAAPRSASPTSSRPSVVLILTDDQRWDTLWAMPVVRSRLARRGMSFSNAFVTTPLCCPSRASLLTGELAHSHGVYQNLEGYERFAPNEASTLAVWLDRAGYRTGLFGKYLNDYLSEHVEEVPQGWDRWMAFVNEPGTEGYRLSVDGSLTKPGGYSTDVLRDAAISFIDETPPEQPVFVYYAPYAPHEDALPASRHRGAFANIEPWRPPAYEEADVSDKPRYIQARDRLTDSRRDDLDAFRITQLESLLAVDEAVGAILDTLRRSGRLSNAIIVFTSDNGIQWGEHRVYAEKSVPYEESIRVPLIIRHDPLIARGGTEDRFALNIDLAPTIADLVGVRAPQVDGRSLVPILAGEDVTWREDFLIEYSKEDLGILGFCGVRTSGHTYVLYRTGEEELYDLLHDPAQLDNRAGDPALAETLERLRARTADQCVPPPPGLTVPAGW
jgi:N-acetylglucosamine-6-sulfatase